MPPAAGVAVYRSPRMAALVGVGFASGLPMVLVSDTLAAWLSTVQIDVKTIGLFSLVGLPYAFKFLWAPAMDRYIPPGLRSLGRRRGWLALLQAMLALCLFSLGWVGPQSAEDSVLALAIVGTAIVVLSASQDIVADAYRTDVLDRHELGAGAAVFVTGYRIALIIGGAFVLMIAKHIGWPLAYSVMACLMGASVIVTLYAPQPTHHHDGPPTLREAVTEPIRQFFQRGTAAIILLALFVLVFRLPDHLANAMTMPLLIKHLQFTIEEVGLTRQLLGFFLTIIGALVGGGIVAKCGLLPSLILFGVLQTLSNAGFLVIANTPPNVISMTIVIGIESFCGGLVAAGFVAFLMSCCDRRYSATQYALLTAIMAASKSLGGAITGYAVARMGYPGFFLLTILVGIPGLAMLPWITRVNVRLASPAVGTEPAPVNA